MKPAASTKFEFALVIEMPVLLTDGRQTSLRCRNAVLHVDGGDVEVVSGVEGDVMADVPSFELVDDM